MARFDEYGRLCEWTDDITRASFFDSEHAAQAAIRGICAPEIRAAIRAGHAAIVHAVDGDGEETGEVHVVDAHDRYELFPTPRIRLDVGPRFLDDDPLRSAVTRHEERGAAQRARELVRELFREAPRLNWPVQTKPRISAGDVLLDEYRTPMSAREKRARAYSGYTGRAAA